MRKIPVHFGDVKDIVQFVNIVNNFDCDIDLQSGSHIVDAKSIIGVCTLQGARNLEMLVHLDNDQDVINRVSKYI